MYKLFSKITASTAMAAMLVLGGVASSEAVSIDPTVTNITDSDLSNAVADDGAFDIFSGPYFFLATFVRTDTEGEIVFEIANTGPAAQVVELSGSIDQLRGTFLGGLIVGWDGAGNQSIAEGASATFSILTTIAAGQSDFVRIDYGDVAANTFRAGIDLKIAAVPLPPALLMLGTALFGLGLLGWRRARAAA